MTIANNPVGRLHSLLTNLPRASGKQMGTSLAGLTGADVNDSCVVMSLYADLAKLTVDSKKSIQKLQGFSDDDISNFNEPLNKIAKVLAENSANAPCNHVLGAIGSEALAALKVTSMLIGRDHPESEVSTDQLEDLLKQFQEIQNEIIDAQIDTEFKSIILRNIDNLIIAIRHYRIYGTAGLQFAIESALGGVVIAGMNKPQEAQKEGFREILTRYATVLNFAITVINLGAQSNQHLIEPLTKLLGLPSN